MAVSFASCFVISAAFQSRSDHASHVFLLSVQRIMRILSGCMNAASICAGLIVQASVMASIIPVAGR